MSDIKRMLERMKTANENPSSQCNDGGEHDFKHKIHADGTESYSNYYECTKCEEWVVRTQKRTGDDLSFWRD